MPRFKAVGGQEAIDAEQAGEDAEYQHHGEVGSEEKHTRFMVNSCLNMKTGL
jgi:hypothetical protein